MEDAYVYAFPLVIMDATEISATNTEEAVTGKAPVNQFIHSVAPVSYTHLNSLLRMSNIDVYVTGSNSKFLSSDIVTEFRGRGDEIRIYPLSFAEDVYKRQEVEALRKAVNFGLDNIEE